MLYGHQPRLDEIALTAGCNQAFVVAMLALAKAGERVLLPAPWYFNHQMTLQMLGIEACPLPCRAAHGFVPQLADAEALIDARTRAIVLVSPNNPTGAVYPPETLAGFAELCATRGLWLVLDETYRDFLPDGVARPHDLFADARLRPHLIQLYSFSKPMRCLAGGSEHHRAGARHHRDRQMAGLHPDLPRPRRADRAGGRIARAFGLARAEPRGDQCAGGAFPGGDGRAEWLAGGGVRAYFAYASTHVRECTPRRS